MDEQTQHNSTRGADVRSVSGLMVSVVGTGVHIVVLCCGTLMYLRVIDGGHS